jgi:hypothetical protein
MPRVSPYYPAVCKFYDSQRSQHHVFIFICRVCVGGGGAMDFAGLAFPDGNSSRSDCHTRLTARLTARLTDRLTARLTARLKL